MSSPPPPAAEKSQVVLPEIKIGAILPMSGPVPSFGTDTRDGIELAVKERNARGGIAGRKIMLIVEDGQCTADPSVAAISRLISVEHVHYVLGEVCSRATIPVSEIANAAGVIQITPTSTNTAVTVDASGRTKPFIFRACFTDPWQGVAGAKFAFHNLGARRAFVLHDPANDYVSGLAASFRTAFRDLGGTIVGDSTYDGTGRDFQSLLADVQAQDPDIIYLPDYYNIVNLVIPQARKMGLSAPFLGGDGWDTPDLNTAAAAGSYYTNHYAPDDPRPQVAAFAEALKTQTSEPPNALSALGYDSAQMLFQALSAVGTDDPAKVRVALEEIRFSGVTGELTFDAQHNPLKTAVIMGVHPDGVSYQTSIAP